ncbi:hypothetical protein C8R45DRAFT_1091612 [Mycena sanguinolenta]|nr:hypothetical protein C8R45DRAFT_1091612 [Mycena sanguinolenta]
MSLQSTLCWHTAAHNAPDQMLLHFVGPRGCTDGACCEREWAIPPAKSKSQKIKLFDRSEDLSAPQPGLDIVQGLPSTIISDLPGHYTAAERQAHVRIASAQHAAVEATAGRPGMLGHVALMAELVGGAHAREEGREAEWAQKAGVQRAWLKAEVDCKASESMVLSKQYFRGPNGEALDTSEWYICSNSIRRKIRLIYPQGRHAVRDKPLSEDDLYLSDMRPVFLTRPRLQHTCSLCLNAKSHPVKYVPRHVFLSLLSFSNSLMSLIFQAGMREQHLLCVCARGGGAALGVQ